MMIAHSTEQKQMALERAFEVKAGHAHIRANVRALEQRDGLLLVASLLAAPTGHVPSMRIGRLLQSVQRVGRSTTHRWLIVADVRSAERRVRELSPRQRDSLIGLVRSFASRKV